VFRDIRQQHAVGTSAAALNNLSSAAELGNVELTFKNAVASAVHESRLLMGFSLDLK